VNRQEIEKSIDEVTRAIDNLNRVFDKRAADLKQAGDLSGLQEWTKACQAMRDSGNIYITWAQHYARLSDATVPSDDENDFLNEGTVLDENPAGP
jgi:hypothetical protein